MSKKKQQHEYKPGSLGSYLIAAGWEPIPQHQAHPLWRRPNDERQYTGAEAWREYLVEVWKRTRENNNARIS